MTLARKTGGRKVKTQWSFAACLHGVAVLVILFGVDSDAPAAARYVSPNGGNRYPYLTPEDASRSIQLAVEAAEEGEEVLVGPGSYGEHVNLKEGVRLSGTWRDDVTIYGVTPGKPVLTLTWDNVVKMLTVVGSPYAGAGIYAALGVPPGPLGKFRPFRIADCTIRSCAGPGILMMAGYDPTRMPPQPWPPEGWMGTWYASPEALPDRVVEFQVELSACWIEHCRGSGLVVDIAKVPDGYDILPPASPPGPQFNCATVIVSHSEISHCGEHGLAVRADSGGRAQAIIDRCVILENGGCGVYVTSAGGTPSGAILQIDNSLVASNGRAGVYCLSIDYSLRKLSYWLYWPPEVPKTWATGLVSALFTTIARNSIGIAGSSPFPGLVPMHGPRVFMTNCINSANKWTDFDFAWWGEGGQLFAGGITHSCTGNEELADTDGNLDSDPLFTDPEKGDFTLRPGSPCIDAGGMCWQATITLQDGTPIISWDAGKDLDGNPRIAGNGPDMGAYEAAGDPPNYLVETSEDLADWMEEYYGPATSWTDPDSGSVGTKFYRIRVGR